MEIETALTGGGGGVVGWLIGFLTLKNRIQRLEDCAEDVKKEYQSKNVCEVLHRNVAGQITELKQDQSSRFDKIDQIVGEIHTVLMKR